MYYVDYKICRSKINDNKNTKDERQKRKIFCNNKVEVTRYLKADWHFRDVYLETTKNTNKYISEAKSG